MPGGVFSGAKLHAMTIRESATDGSDFTNPDADYRRLFLGEDGLIHVKDSAGAVTDPYAVTASVPGWVDAFAGTTATNNYYWDGNDLAGFTELDVTGTTTWTEANSLVSVLVAGVTSGDLNVQLIAKTFSIGDAWVLPVIGAIPTTVGGSAMAGIVFTDGVISTSNCVAGVIQAAASVLTPVGRHGTLTAATTAPWVLDANIGGQFAVFIKLIYSAANTFQMLVSPDGITYHGFAEADIAKTMTPTHVGLCAMNVDADGGIFTFGPMLKTA